MGRGVREVGVPWEYPGRQATLCPRSGEEGRMSVKALHLGRCAFAYAYYVPTPPAFKPKDFLVHGRLISRLQ